MLQVHGASRRNEPLMNQRSQTMRQKLASSVTSVLWLALPNHSAKPSAVGSSIHD